MAHLAQLNLARLKAPKGDPLSDEFFKAIGPINALAEVQPGFVWRLVGDVKDHTDIPYFLDPTLVVNMSVWEDFTSFMHFVYQTGHAPYLKRRKEWMKDFEEGPASVMWWVEPGEQINLELAQDKLNHLRKNGASEEAFDLAFARSRRWL